MNFMEFPCLSIQSQFLLVTLGQTNIDVKPRVLHILLYVYPKVTTAYHNFFVNTIDKFIPSIPIISQITPLITMNSH